MTNKEMVLDYFYTNTRVTTEKLYNDLEPFMRKENIRKNITLLRNEGHDIRSEKIDKVFHYAYYGNLKGDKPTREVLKSNVRNEKIVSMVHDFLRDNEIVYLNYFSDIHKIPQYKVTKAIEKLRLDGHNIFQFQNETKEIYYVMFKDNRQFFSHKEKDFHFRRNKDNNTPIVHFKFETDSVKIIPIGDLHLSSQEDVTEIRELFEQCRENNIYIALMGDLIENSSKHSIADGIYNQKLNPQEQIDAIKYILYDYSDIILFMISGNHEIRTYVHTGVDVAKIIADFTGIPYIKGRCFGFIDTNKCSKKFHASHKTSGGVLKTTKRKGIYKKTKEQFSADIFFAGHLHDSVSEEQMFYLEIDKDTLKMRRRFWIAMMCPSTLKYWGGYGDRNCFEIPNNDIYYLEIDSNGWLHRRLLRKCIEVV